MTWKWVQRGGRLVMVCARCERLWTGAACACGGGS